MIRIHSSSGTTGTPVIIPYTMQDVTDWAEIFKRCYETAGLTNLDRIQITPGYGLWTAGIGFQTGAELLGAMVIPMGPGNTDKQIQMMRDLKAPFFAQLLPMRFFLQKKLQNEALRMKFASKRELLGQSVGAKRCAKGLPENSGLSFTTFTV